MGKRERVWSQLADSVDLPGETVPGQSILELMGDSRVLIEHHRGVQEYTREKISVKLRFGSVTVCGYGLELIHMTREQLVIRGRIDGISIHRR